MATPQTYDLFDTLDKDFHRKIYARAGILNLWSTVRRQSVHLDRLRRLNLPMPGKMQNVLKDHQEIVGAIQSGRPEPAESAMRRHLSGTLSIIDLISDQFPDYVRK